MKNLKTHQVRDEQLWNQNERSSYGLQTKVYTLHQKV